MIHVKLYVPFLRFHHREERFENHRCVLKKGSRKRIKKFLRVPWLQELLKASNIAKFLEAWRIAIFRIYKTCKYILKHKEQLQAFCINALPFPSPPTCSSPYSVPQNFHYPVFMPDHPLRGLHNAPSRQ